MAISLGRPRSLSLDFLGFSCPNQDLSMGYAAWSREIFFSALSLPFAAPGRELGGEAMRKRRNACGKLNLIPLFSNKLSSERFSFGQLQSKISSLQRNGNVDHFFGPDPRRLERRGGSVGAAIAPARPTSSSNECLVRRRSVRSISRSFFGGDGNNPSSAAGPYFMCHKGNNAVVPQR